MADTAAGTVLAIDIGGTKIAVALIGADGEVIAETTAPTLRSPDPEAIFTPAADAIREVLGSWSTPGDPLRVGISSAGPIDAPAGTVSPVNIGAWRAFPVVARVTAVVTEVTGTAPAVALAGDGHCIALGEHWLGAGRDVDSMIGMVLSTGVGGGVVIDNELYVGTTGNAVHLGHISVNAWGPRCVCGCHGCTEMYARGPAMVAAAKRAGWTGGDDAQALTADARAGDMVAMEAIDFGMRALAAGIATTATEFDVSFVVLGGGVSKAGEVIFGPLRQHLVDFTTLPYVQGLVVVPAELDNASLLGAAALALRLTSLGRAQA